MPICNNNLPNQKRIFKGFIIIGAIGVKPKLRKVMKEKEIEIKIKYLNTCSVKISTCELQECHKIFPPEYKTYNRLKLYKTILFMKYKIICII